MTLPPFTDVFAVPGRLSIIDCVNPETGRSLYNGKTLEQIRLSEPDAVQMTWEDWRGQTAAQQHTPVTWNRITAKQYNDALGVLFPAAWEDGSFLIGEPHDHDCTTGQPRFYMYRRRGSHWYEINEVSSRPVTHKEFRTLKYDYD